MRLLDVKDADGEETVARRGWSCTSLRRILQSLRGLCVVCSSLAGRGKASVRIRDWIRCQDQDREVGSSLEPVAQVSEGVRSPSLATIMHALERC